jgi:hypothetical protein
VLLPNASDAFVDLRKLRDYCLSLDDPRGRHKARLFRSVLGLTEQDAEILKEALLAGAITSAAQPAQADEHGARFMVDMEITLRARTGRVRTAWIVRTGENFPRLLTCYVL